MCSVVRKAGFEKGEEEIYIYLALGRDGVRRCHEVCDGTARNS